jgi:hypothetical protein
MKKTYEYFDYHINQKIELISSGEVRLPKEGEYYLFPYGDTVGYAVCDFTTDQCEILVPVEKEESCGICCYSYSKCICATKEGGYRR